MLNKESCFSTSTILL